MIYKDIEIYECKFFSVGKNKKLQFSVGKFKGKTADDFNSLTSLQEITAYCFWIINNKEVPIISKYLASSFISDLSVKMAQVEKKLWKKVSDKQDKLKKETKKSEKVVGTVYGK